MTRDSWAAKNFKQLTIFEVESNVTSSCRLSKQGARRIPALQPFERVTKNECQKIQCLRIKSAVIRDHHEARLASVIIDARPTVPGSRGRGAVHTSADWRMALSATPLVILEPASQRKKETGTTQRCNGNCGASRILGELNEVAT